MLLYAEANLASLRQMFVDASQTKPIEPFTVARFDQQDAFNAAAVQLACQSRLLKGRVEMERSYVLRSSECVLAINQLVVYSEGHGVRESPPTIPQGTQVHEQSGAGSPVLQRQGMGGRIPARLPGRICRIAQRRHAGQGCAGFPGCIVCVQRHMVSHPGRVPHDLDPDQ